MVKLILIRHGYSMSNKERTLTGQADVPLCSEGFKQAQLLADYLVDNFNIDAIYSSDLIRAVDTILPTAKKLNLPITKVKALREINVGKWENVPFATLESEYKTEYTAWLNDIVFARCPDGESFIDAHKRSLEFIQSVCENNSGKTIVMVTHGGIIRPFQCLVQGVDIKLLDTIDWAPNASVSIFNYENGKFTDEVIGYTEHLKGLITVLNL